MNEQARSSGPTEPPRLFCGVDIGASATKLVLIDGDGNVLSRVVHASGVNYRVTAERCLAQALAEIQGRTGSPGGLPPLSPADVAATVATGYGRHNVPFAGSAMTEIHCHGLGCFHYFPRALSIVDIGGQDNKVIRLEADGRRANFKMNRKCAAGTGAFLEEIALRLGLKMEEMDPLARSAEAPVALNSFCTVFAKTEILAHIRQGAPIEGIVRGAFVSVINRVVEMDALPGEVVLTGGVVQYNPTIAEILSQKLGREVSVPPHPQFTGALGAALSARAQATDS